MSVNDPTSPRPSPVSAVADRIADPGPLGLAGFAATTFFLSTVNAGLLPETVESGVFGLAIFYGGIAQLLAGMWEFAKGNTFGATAFSSYGAFWLSFWYLTGHTDLTGVGADDAAHGIGLYLLAWGIFTAYMTVAATRVSGAVLAVFALLTITFVILAIGDLSTTEGITKLGGWFGLATAVAAWYASFGGITAFSHGKPLVPTAPHQH